MKKSICLSLIAIALLFRNDAFGDLPDEIEELTSSYQQKREEVSLNATKRLDDEYEDRLTALQEKYTKSGRLEGALEIDSLLKERALRKSAPGQWAWGDSKRTLTLFPTGEARLTDESEHLAWLVIDPKTIRLFFPSTSYTITFDDSKQAAIAERRGDGLKVSLKQSE